MPKELFENPKLAAMEKMREANVNQKNSINRLMTERAALLDLLSEVHSETEQAMNSVTRNRVETILSEAGYDIT